MSLWRVNGLVVLQGSAMRVLLQWKESKSNLNLCGPGEYLDECLRENRLFPAGIGSASMLLAEFSLEIAAFQMK